MHVIIKIVKAMKCLDENNKCVTKKKKKTYVTGSREMSHLSAIFNFEFQYNLLAHIKFYILIHTPLQSDIWFKRYEQFFVFQNNVKHGNMSSVLAYNSKSILATSESFLLIMSHI